MASDPRWEQARRLEEWAGEARVNLMRAAALVVFYANHLLDVYLFTEDRAALQGFHSQASALTLAWAAAAVALHYALARRWVPPALKFVAVGVDLLLVTALLALAPDGPRSSLVLLYFLVLASVPLRMSLPLVYFGTLAAMGGYLVVLGDYVFRRVGWEAYYAPGGPRVPRSQEILTLLALGTAGLLAGQVVRQARRMVLGYPVHEAPPRPPA